MIEIQNRRYLGNKFKLLSFIDEIIEHICPGLSSLFDVFSGTGVVAYYFMDRMKVITNDSLYSNYLIHVAFMSEMEVDEKKINKLLTHYNSITADNISPNYFSETFGNTYFSFEDCKKIGYIRENIEYLFDLKEINERERAVLISILLYGMDKIANTCGHYDAYRKCIDYKKHLILDRIDLSKKAVGHNEFYNEDSNLLIKKEGFSYVDCVYCDPPYNSRNYCDLYHVLENTARWEKPLVHGIARKMDRSNLKSLYCTKKASELFEELVIHLNCRYIILSYNNTGNNANERSNARMSDEDILRILSTKGKIRIFSKSYRAFTTGKSHNNQNEERLFVCEVV